MTSVKEIMMRIRNHTTTRFCSKCNWPVTIWWERRKTDTECPKCANTEFYFMEGDRHRLNVIRYNKKPFGIRPPYNTKIAKIERLRAKGRKIIMNYNIQETTKDLFRSVNCGITTHDSYGDMHRCFGQKIKDLSEWSMGHNG